MDKNMDNKNRMISIIVPVYKSEDTLERCIGSLLQQTYENIEIIMTVDGPPDASGILAERLAAKDERIQVIFQKNQGVSAARNAGIKAARGEYIQFVDSDDYVAPDACEILVRAMETNESQMVICGFHHLYFGRDVQKAPSLCGTFEKAEALQVFLDLYGEQFLNMPWNKLFQRAYITEYFRRDISLGEDLLFNISYLQNIQRFTVIQNLLNYYIQDGRGTTLSTKKRDDRIQMAFLLYEEVKKFCMENFGSRNTRGILESKVLVEFLDEIEGIAWVKSSSSGQPVKTYRMQIIKTYREALDSLPNLHQVTLSKLDYRIIYFFFKRRKLHMTYWLIMLRGLIVQALKGRQLVK